MISIDQNCNSLWDVIPKLQALSRRGWAVTQYIEDIDVAFTSVGSDVHAGALRIERERFYRSGGADWGAALFYSEFLGRLPVEIRHWEPFTGMKTDVLARHLGQTVDDLYDEFSPGDNWQLIGPSYVGDARHHRTIGDLGLEEVSDYVRQMIGIAREDVQRCFEASPFLAQGLAALAVDEGLLAMARPATARLAEDFYADSLAAHVGGGAVEWKAAGALFGLAGAMAGRELLELFTRDYDLAAGLYNQAIEESQLGLRLLDTEAGELPFFGVFGYLDHRVRSGAFLEGEAIRIADMTFPLASGRTLPLEAMAKAGIVALPGKAILLVLQVRMGPSGQPLAMPYHGSMYMAASYKLQGLLAGHGLLGPDVKPIVRVRFGVLGRMRSLDTAIHLPGHLAAAMGRSQVAASELGGNWRSLQVEAKERLASFRDDVSRRRWQSQAMPQVAGEIEQLDARRRELAARDDKDPQLRQIWKQLKPLQAQQLQALVRQIAIDWQVSQIDYWDSRGAIGPWCVAMGGQPFYNQVVEEAEIYDEGP